MNKKHKITFATFALFGLLLLGSPSLPASAAWKTTSAGKMYTQKASPGYVTGMKQIDGKWYFFNNKGIMQKSCFVKLDGKTYYFLKSGVRETGWMTIKKTGKKYYFNSKGVMQTGKQTIKKKMYYFNKKGVLQTGWITDDKKTRYYADKNGVLVTSTWVDDCYLQEDGTMAVNTWIDGKEVGPDGKFTGRRNNIGWVTENGKTYYYNASNTLVKGWLTIGGKLYYLHRSTGVLQKNVWLTISGKTYYADSKGVIQKNAWVGNKYLTSSGVMATGMTTIANKTYYFDSKGERKIGWVKYNKKYYYFDSNGVLLKNQWVNEKYYVDQNGCRCAGFTVIGGNTYYFNSDGVLQTGWIIVDGERYFTNGKGQLHQNGWLSSKKYYASATGAMLKGLNQIGSSLYYFDPNTCVKVTSKKVDLDGASYYFKSSGAAGQNEWVTIGSKDYYCQSDGMIAKSTWINNYYVDETGARTNQAPKNGWMTVNGGKYFFDINGKMLKSIFLRDKDGYMYYLSADGTMVTGLYQIGSNRYYFHSDGRKAVSTTLAIGPMVYTLDEQGRIIKEENISVVGNTLGTQIVQFALQYVGNKYVYGGNSLTNGTDCSGFTNLVFAHFGIKLLRVADDQMKGPSAAYIKQGYVKGTEVPVDLQSLQPGDLLFYGSGNYASHVAIYMGDGQIVHASNSQPYPKGGIKISDYDYQTPIKAIRYWAG